MSNENRRRARLRQVLHWAQRGRCAGCGELMGLGKQAPRARPTYPTFDHVMPKSQGGTGGLANGLLKHRACNEGRGDTPPTGCDRIWQRVAHDRLASPEAERRWGISWPPEGC